ncbi:hypothetical protein GCM10007028_19080 [Algibacter mikhailovii]|uniref:Uncharacterized protein n=1 Tax=Algibacter mikhailovii TaxID=425498 RepID=A0A918R0L9_9FLAO|nr:hypothetical protein GCM10007028_19080 [Algibacter mikhailovii]
MSFKQIVINAFQITKQTIKDIGYIQENTSYMFSKHITKTDYYNGKQNFFQ